MSNNLKKPWRERMTELHKTPQEALANRLFDDHINQFIASECDVSKGELDPQGFGKRIPYLGFFWRDCLWSERRALPDKKEPRSTDIQIGKSEFFVGFMENNKWGYPQRYLTVAEVETILDLIDDAAAAYNKAGTHAKLREETGIQWAKLWAYMQTLEIPAKEGTS